MTKFKAIKLVLTLTRQAAIRRRQAKSSGNAEYLVEAEAFEQKIDYLRERYSITEEILFEEQRAEACAESDREFVFHVGSKLFRRKRIFWQQQIFSPLCPFFDCVGLFQAGSNLKTVIGEKPQRRKVATSYLHLHEGGEELADNYIELVKQPESSVQFINGQTRLFRQSFLYGFSEGVARRILKANENRSAIADLEALINQKKKDSSPTARPDRLLGAKTDFLEPQTSPAEPVNTCTSLIKATRIIVRPRVNSEPFIEAPAAGKLPESKIKEYDKDCFNVGLEAGGMFLFDETLMTEIQALSDRLKSLQQQIEVEKRDRDLEKECYKRPPHFGLKTILGTFHPSVRSLFDLGDLEAS